MDIGVAMPTHGLLKRDDENFFLQVIKPEDVRPIEFAQHAEKHDFHSVWFSDHVVMGRDLSMHYPAQQSGKKAYPQRPTMFDAAAVMGGLCVATTKLKFAPSVHIAPYRHPLATAQQFATLDYMSKGRLIFGVGIGWEEEEYRALNANFEQRGGVTEECIEIYKRAWRDEWIDFDGKHFQIHDVSMDPKPWQQPHPPIIYGANTDVGARRAARCCDGLYTVHLDPYPPVDIWASAKEAALREGERLGRDMSDFWYGTFASALICDADDPIIQGEKRPTLTGTAEQILEDLQAFADHGFQHITCHFHVRSNTIDELFELTERFGKEVLPEAKGIKAASLV
jgi:probable F420-dependent oxidoreductase